jgi:hypothetical protein
VGKWGDDSGTADYDGGHMLGSQLGGYGKRLNMVPQIANFNRGNWVQLENKAARCVVLQPGRLVYWVGVSYANTTELIPNTMSQYLEDTQTNAAIEVTFDNAAAGRPNGWAERDRGVQSLSQLGCN